MSFVDLTLYTVGHSNRSRGDLLDLLGSVGVEILVDVRRVPRSTRNPHFDGVKLRRALEDAGLVYHWAGRQLGGGYGRPRKIRPMWPWKAVSGAMRTTWRQKHSGGP